MTLFKLSMTDSQLFPSNLYLEQKCCFSICKIDDFQFGVVNYAAEIKKEIVRTQNFSMQYLLNFVAE